MHKERPILFSAPMVRALLDGSKTQTRRALKVRCQEIGERDDGSRWPWSEHPDNAGDHWHACPYGQPGDRLWVRETFSDIYGAGGDEVRRKQEVMYRANGETDPYVIGGRWTPSIHMPRWASRILLEIVSVRVERLQEISADDCRAEGVESHEVRQFMLYGASPAERAAIYRDAAVGPYRGLWERINGGGSWDVNPWVWVVEFKRVAATTSQGEAK